MTNANRPRHTTHRDGNVTIHANDGDINLYLSGGTILRPDHAVVTIRVHDERGPRYSFDDQMVRALNGELSQSERFAAYLRDALDVRVGTVNIDDTNKNTIHIPPFGGEQYIHQNQVIDAAYEAVADMARNPHRYAEIEGATPTRLAHTDVDVRALADDGGLSSNAPDAREPNARQV